MTDLNHAHRTRSNRVVRCADTGCTTPAAYETTTLYRDRTTDRIWLGTWQPQCAECALDDATGIRDHGLHGSRAIATTLRPLGATHV